jgi:hypothetical protein
MIIRCPNKECNVKIPVHNAILNNPQAKAACPVCKTSFRPSDYKPPENVKTPGQNQTPKYKFPPKPKTEIKGDQVKQTKAYLVVHDEKAPTQTFELRLGLNLFGRKRIDFIPNKKHDHFHGIDTQDFYMSKENFFIEVVKNYGNLLFILKDADSANGTRIDVKRIGAYEREIRALRKDEEVYLSDDALIVAGKTNIHFKTETEATAKKDVTELISNQKITKTVIL